MSLDLEKPGAEPTRPGRRLGVLKNQPYVNPPTKVMLVWLESYEDHITFPVGQYRILYGCVKLYRWMVFTLVFL